MYWLVETNSQLEKFASYNFKKALIYVEQCDIQSHAADTKISFIYIKPLDYKKGFIFPINHTDCFKLDTNKVKSVLESFSTLYCIDKKRILHLLELKNLIDFVTPPYSFDIEGTQTHSVYNRFYSDQKNLNNIIPIVKHYEKFESVFKKIDLSKIDLESKYLDFYNNKVIPNYFKIEQASLGINKELFSYYFYKTDKNQVYTEYNLNTSTTRPSNKSRGVNFAALNKKNNVRKSFVPRNNFFIEIDIIAYHPTLISHMIGYEFKTDDIHQEFADMYKVSREKAKQITFQQFYGKVFDKYKNLYYFKELLVLQDQIYDSYLSNGYYEDDISGYRFKQSNYGSLSKEKLFNYLLQCRETSTNVIILEKLHKILENYKSKIALTVYDSFLLDFEKKEKHLLNDIKEVFDNHRLKLSVKSGINYEFI